jgi:hypothetical protein
MKRLVLLPLIVLLAACGSAGGSGSASSTPSAAAGTGTTTSAPTTAATSTSTPSSTTTTTAPPTTAAADRSRCRAANLALSFLGQQGGMGHGEIGFKLRNMGSGSCRTYGYPGILFLDRRGHGLPTIPHHTTLDFFGSGPAPQHLVIGAGHSASFRLDVGHGVATANGCATAYALQVIPPDDTASLRTTIPTGSYECRDANVSPLRAGTSAYP